MSQPLPPADEVVLLDEGGLPVGSSPRLEVHGPATPLHLAFSVHLRDETGAVLLTRRALGKTTWPGVWTNSCCGHPRPGEPIEDAIVRRVREELGAHVTGLRQVLPDFRYRAVDASGVVENEICPVFIGDIRREDLAPNTDEVIEHAWVWWADVVGVAANTPQLLSPWSVLQWQAIGPHYPWA